MSAPIAERIRAALVDVADLARDANDLGTEADRRPAGYVEARRLIDLAIHLEQAARILAECEGMARR